MESLIQAGAAPEQGTGACAQAQPDGVPCTCLGTDCETCAQRRDASPEEVHRPAGRPAGDVSHA